jgi:AbiV family abortive infection protein
MEEEGKTGLFTVLSLADSDSEVQEFWKNYRRHTAKNRHLLFIKAMGPDRENGVLSATEEALRSHVEAAAIENTKQLCTYTDCVRLKEWHSPELIPVEFQKQLATGIVFICRSFSFFEITQQQLGIYAKHLKPAKGASREYVEHALVECLRELQQAGILAVHASDAELIDLICGTK